MFLFEEYAIRNKIIPEKLKYIKKGFAFFDEDNKLFVIKWMDANPGFYEISECFLEKCIKTNKLENISWEDYEYYLLEWASKNKIETDKKKVFNLTWEYFVRRNDFFLMKNYGPLEVFPTIDDHNPNRILDSIKLLEKISLKNKNIYDSWNNKISEVINLYCYWLAEI